MLNSVVQYCVVLLYRFVYCYFAVLCSKLMCSAIFCSSIHHYGALSTSNCYLFFFNYVQFLHFYIFPFFRFSIFHLFTFSFFLVFFFLFSAFMTVVAMCAKTLRIFVLVKAGLRKKKITATQVLGFTGSVYVFWIVYLLIYSVMAPPHIDHKTYVSITGQQTVETFCSSHTVGFDTTLYVIECLILLASAWLCYGTRDVPDAINEAQVIVFGKCVRARQSLCVCVCVCLFVCV